MQECCLSTSETALARRLTARVLIGVLHGVGYKRQRHAQRSSRVFEKRKECGMAIAEYAGVGALALHELVTMPLQGRLEGRRFPRL